MKTFAAKARELPAPTASSRRAYTRRQDVDQLTALERAFVNAYVADPFADRVAAFAVAGYRIPSGRERDVRAAASRVLKKTRVVAAILRARARQISQTDISAVKTLRELACIAYANPADMFDNDGKLLPIKAIPPNVQRALLSMEHKIERGKNPDTILKWKMQPKLAALEILMKHQGLLDDNINIQLRAGGIPIASVREAIRLANVEDAEFVEITQDKFFAPKQLASPAPRPAGMTGPVAPLTLDQLRFGLTEEDK